MARPPHGLVLIVEDDPRLGPLLQSWLSERGLEALLASGGEQALELFGRQAPDVVLTDLVMPGMSGLDLCRRLRELDRTLPVLLLTSFGSIPSAVDAMRSGATDYLCKPIQPDELLVALERALESRALLREVARLRSALDERYSFDTLVARSPAMAALVAEARRLASREVTVLICGESGSGKEHLARAIHLASPRRDQALVAVDCGGLTESLLESELFGHERGAFSGAVCARPGLFVEADGGSLLLDEVANMSAGLQVKLLRALQERAVRAVGANRDRPVDVRLLACTQADLQGEIAAGRFRADLYYRLAVVCLRLPPLRERPEDLPELAARCLAQRTGSGGARRLSKAASARLLGHAWPGNVRELEHTLARAALLCEGEVIQPEHLGLGPDPAGVPLRELTRESRQRITRQAMLDALRRTNGNRSQAAQRLGISRTRFYQLVRELELDKP
ncbi:MAG TPA: sigma-54 dependent transcriptional regulator [Myxococcota bacterium]|nr:sigma-54 dependent transcriptional regulator [Myxococcota bacterium]HRY95282.1 sigma-54 dependent transcriptional regulator [Myxococcota bacterium]HSA22342.1 sigma-54 dependent transcriptional regulator [Myxococcota bacterium]